MDMPVRMWLNSMSSRKLTFKTLNILPSTTDGRAGSQLQKSRHPCGIGLNGQGVGGRHRRKGAFSSHLSHICQHRQNMRLTVVQRSGVPCIQTRLARTNSVAAELDVQVYRRSTVNSVQIYTESSGNTKAAEDEFHAEKLPQAAFVFRSSGVLACYGLDRCPGIGYCIN